MGKNLSSHVSQRTGNVGHPRFATRRKANSDINQLLQFMRAAEKKKEHANGWR